MQPEKSITAPSTSELLLRWQELRDQGQEVSLEELCAGNTELLADLRRHVEALASMQSLLESDRDSGRLTVTHDSTGATAGNAQSDAFPKRIGRFQVRRFLGEGAFGAVYEGYDPQLDRAVAIKVAKLGRSDADQRVKRFLREAKAAAGLRHPHIVPVHEFGQEGDLFYIVSAFIQGRTLQQSLKEQHERKQPPDLPRAGRIVRQLAEALAYAHGQGIVHRDVKPGNVMLDEKDQPMLMDFGLASRQEDAEKLTHAGIVMGTPMYMAPEQARGASGVPLPASDQYSLGVMLFEMIAGQPPFSGTIELVMQQHQETDPPRPKSINKAISRDLDTICLKCLEKEPDRRYTDESALAEDLRRWQEGEPITARRIGAVERTARWCRKNRLTAAALGAVAAMLLIGSTVAWVLAAWALQESEHANEQRKQAQQQAEKAERDAKKSKRIAEVLTGMFEAADPLGLNGIPALKLKAGENLTARDILKRGADRVAHDLTAEPDTQAQLTDIITNVYCTLGLTDEAKPLLQKSLVLRREKRASDPLGLATTLQNLAWVEHMTGDYTSAGQHYRESLAIRREHAKDDPILVSNTLVNLSWLLADLEEFAEAENMFKEAIAIRIKLNGPNDRDVAVARAGLAGMYIAQQKHTAAIMTYLQAMSTLSKVEGSQGLIESVMLFQKGVMARNYPAGRLLLGMKNDADIEVCLKRSLDLARESLGNPRLHAYVGLVLHELAITMMQHHKEAEAEAYFRDCLAVVRGYGLEHPKIGYLLANFCYLLQRRGKGQEAEQLLQDALKARRNRYPADQYAIADALYLLGSLHNRSGRTSRARHDLREALMIYCKSPYAPGGFDIGCVALLQEILPAAELHEIAAELQQAAAREEFPKSKRDRYRGLSTNVLRRAQQLGIAE